MSSTEEKFRDGDVVRYSPERANNWCREGTAVHFKGRLIDTYWDLSGGEDHVLSAVEVESAALIFNTGDYDQLPQYDRGNRLKWERYAPEDRERFTAQHGLQARWFIRKGATEDLATQVENARQRLTDARDGLSTAQWRVASAERDLDELTAKLPVDASLAPVGSSQGTGDPEK